MPITPLDLASTNKSPTVGDAVAEQTQDTVIDDAAGDASLIHSNAHRQYMRNALKNAYRDVAPPEFLKNRLDD